MATESKEKEAEKKENYLGRVNVEEKPKIYKITIPDTMNKAKAADELYRMHDEENSIRSYSHTFENRYFVDTLKVVNDAMKEHLGAIKPTSKWRTEDHVYRVDQDGKEHSVSVGYGRFQIPAWENATFVLGIADSLEVELKTESLKKKYEGALNDLVGKIRDGIRGKSLYEGSTVRVERFRTMFGEIWKFTAFANVPNERIFLNETEKSVVNNYMIPDLDSDKKRTYLLCGNYGNGKTETAMRIGDEATKRDYIFMYITQPGTFVPAMQMATVYDKCMIFVEDVDNIGSGERDTRLNEMLNTLDGAETKSHNIKVLFTTNHENRLNQALRRPGRLDIILRFENPSSDTLAKIMSSFLWECEGAGSLDFAKAGKLLQSFDNVSGAVAAEVSKRALRLANLKGEINQDLLESAVNSIKTQVELMNQSPETEHDRLATGLAKVGEYLDKY